MQSSWVEESVFALVPTGGPVLAELGHPEVTTDDTDSSGGFCRLGRGALSRRFVGVHGSFVCTPCLANRVGRVVTVWSVAWRLGVWAVAFQTIHNQGESLA